MPRKVIKVVKPFKRLTLKRRRRKLNPKSNKSKTSVDLGVGFPKNLFAKLQYNEVTSISPAAPAAPVNFQINSIYDPDVTYSGHQSAYRDTLAGIYKKYRVNGCFYEVEVIYCDVPTALTVWPSPSTTSATLTEAGEQDQSKQVIFSQVAGTTKKIRGFINVRKFLGLQKHQQHKDLESAMTTGPTTPVYLRLNFDSVAGGNISTVQYRVKLIQWVQCFEKIQMTQS